ncbi:MAG: putative Amidase enhancer protein LytB, partial [Nitrospira sp.]|nr:putative Amidase enhancer protein LytB [Nitrospira sp.]
MDLPPIKLLARLGLCLVIVFSVVMAPNAALAAQSIRVLLSADVYRLDVQADGAVWLTDSSRDGRAIRSDARITAYGKGFLVNGARIAHERLTLRAGDRGLTLMLVKPNDKLPAVSKP